MKRIWFFGDHRSPNVLTKGDAALLVDFDWCDEAEKGKYPAMMNMDGSILWLKGAGPEKIMKKGHDIEMLESLLSRGQ